MSMTEIIEQIGKEILQQRADQQKLLGEITEITSLEFAERAAEELNPTKCLLGCEKYLTLLKSLLTLLLAGMPPNDALDAVQTGWSTEKILSAWRYLQE